MNVDGTCRVPTAGRSAHIAPMDMRRIDRPTVSITGKIVLLAMLASLLIAAVSIGLQVAWEYRRGHNGLESMLDGVATDLMPELHAAIG